MEARTTRHATEAELRSALIRLLAQLAESHGRLERAIDEAAYWLDGPEVEDPWDDCGEHPIDHGDGQPDVRGL